MTESKIPMRRRTIRLFPEYGRDWPLWENSTPTRDVGYTTTPETYDLSSELTHRLAIWNSHWQAHFDPFDGWDSLDNREWWREDGERVRDALTTEVSAYADVSYEPWPLTCGIAEDAAADG